MALNREKIHQSVQRLVLKGQLDKAIQELRPILDEDANDTRTLQKLAELYRKKGAYQEAEGVYARLAEVFMRGGFFQRAVAVHNQILQLNPTNLPVHVALGDTLTRLGLLQEANKIYARTVGLMQRAGRFDDATSILEKLIAGAPDNYQARLQLAELYLKAGRNDAAIKAFEEALPTLREQGRDDLFQRAAERLLYYQPDNMALCRELAVFHLRRGNVPPAMKLLQYCHKRDPQDMDTLRLLAGHFEASGDVDKAVVVLHQMARIFEGRGDSVAAQQTFRRIREIRPGDPEASRALGAGVPLAVPGPPPPRRPAPAPAVPSAPPESEISAELLAPDELTEEPAALVESPAPRPAAGRSTVPPVAAPSAPTAVPPAAARAPASPRPVTQTSQASLPPLPDEPSEVQKIAAEADIFVKFGLRDRAIGHLSGGLTQFPQSVVLRDRIIAIQLNAENLPAAAHMMLDTARVLAPAHRDHARRYVREALFLDEDNAAAQELARTLESGGLPEPVPSVVADRTAAAGSAPPPPPPAAELPGDLDVDIDVAPEPVRTYVVPPPAPPPSFAPRPGLSRPAQPPRALPIDLPSFDEVDDGPPLMPVFPAQPPERLAVPVSAEATAPLVLELDEEDFGDELPVGDLPVEELPTEEPAVEEAAAEEAAAEDEGAEVSVEELPTDELPTQDAAASATETPAAADSVSQELDEVDFFFQQGLVEDARTLLDGLAAEHPDDPRIAQKRAEMDAAGPADAVMSPPPPGDALEALDSAFDALEAAGSGARPMPGATDDEPVAAVPPSDAAMHFDLGIAYREMGVLDRAIDEFRLAAADSAREANCRLLIGTCLVGLGKSREAVEELKRGLHARHKTEQDELELYYGLAEAHLALGDTKEALFYLQTIKRKNPEFKDVAPKINALLSSARPGRRPAPKPGPRVGPAEPESNIDEAFDDLFKGERH